MNEGQSDDDDDECDGFEVLWIKSDDEDSVTIYYTVLSPLSRP